VRNGVVTKPRQLLACLQNDTQELVLREAQLQLDESRVEINDQLITQGGRPGDTTSVSREVFDYIKLRSGYNRALLAVQKARLELDKTFLYAPIGGVVANMSLTAYSPAPADKPFCTLLNRNEMFVRCPILETELGTVQPGQMARVEPVGILGAAYKAKVVEINPIVSTQGLVEVTIRILQPDAKLLPGMNVRVLIAKTFLDKLTIPKEAVVERSARKVLFTFKDGLAKWHYVSTGQANDKEIVITEGLEAGEEVIVTGNLNLGHDAPVEKRVE
jgi:RND family efflux transporter MFP subunit